MAELYGKAAWLIILVSDCSDGMSQRPARKPAMYLCVGLVYPDVATGLHSVSSATLPSGSSPRGSPPSPSLLRCVEEYSHSLVSAGTLTLESAAAKQTVRLLPVLDLRSCYDADLRLHDPGRDLQRGGVVQGSATDTININGFHANIKQ